MMTESIGSARREGRNCSLSDWSMRNLEKDGDHREAEGSSEEPFRNQNPTSTFS
jgi:hypothetical protein